jgi:hypothetical protein
LVGMHGMGRLVEGRAGEQADRAHPRCLRAAVRWAGGSRGDIPDEISAIYPLDRSLGNEDEMYGLTALEQRINRIHK